MEMTLKAPFLIGPRLLPALRIGDCWLYVQLHEYDDSRDVYEWTIDGGPRHRWTYSACDLRSGAGGFRGGLQEAFASMLGFLSAAAEAYRSGMNGRESDNGNLFPPRIMELCYQNDSELQMLACELEENEGLIIED